MNTSTEELIRKVERDLLDRHGPMLADDALRSVLGYRSMDAFRQALVRKTVPVPVFSIKHQRGKFALVIDVANWLVEQRNSAISEIPNLGEGGDVNTTATGGDAMT